MIYPKLTQENVVQELLKNVPELETPCRFDNDELNSPTIVFDKFGDYLLDRIKSHTSEDSIVNKSFGFINTIMSSDNPEVQNLAIVGVFEVLAGSKRAIEIAEELLEDNGMKWLDRVKQDFEAQ